MFYWNRLLGSPLLAYEELKQQTLYLPILIMMAVTARNFHHTVPYSNKIAGVLHVVSWLAQFYGHGVHEKRAPALLDNLLQAIFLAPFFVFIEVLFMLGYRPTLQARLESIFVKDREAFERKSSKKPQ
ncbi:putative endoplasmic reticulum membrane protein [Neolecta irregularis DAH-3]|uniref:Putative endoplasmic reticulum membrane protein n=1 Tax=Neolecta irregularis (strain DAH-3) TaxID=1198029 RepID=A0A1U7LWY4_NEOID|nr:putative endoplasmic reticulum membrane protein [Neolecta irregularis DAH-3]|eukprot:OLL27128.1 putative endoplasmic reticulum membrane protein [Neolecta irregularis DAH-3]